MPTHAKLGGSCVALLFVVTASCSLFSCGSASEASRDAATDAVPVDVRPTSPIVAFGLKDGLYCAGMPPFACDDNYAATRAGTISYYYGYNAVQMATLSDADRSLFAQFLDDPTFVAAIRDMTQCPMPIPDESPVVTLFLEDGEKVSKDINNCRGPLYDGIRRWLGTFRAYFP